MSLLSGAMKLFRTILRSWMPQRRPSPPHRGHSYRPNVEPFESRALPSALTVQSVAIVTQSSILRVAPRTNLGLVVRVTGLNNATGQLVTLTGTADQLAQQASIAVNFVFSSASRIGQRAIANLDAFRNHGIVQLRRGADGLRVRMEAMAGGITSRAVQLVRDSSHGDDDCNGSYEGLFTGTVDSTPVTGPVAFHVVGHRVIVVTAPASGSGELRVPCSLGQFGFGGGSVAGARFTITLQLRSDGAVFADGGWFLPSGGVSGSGDWFANRVGR
jgi:hypothetical protein